MKLSWLCLLFLAIAVTRGENKLPLAKPCNTNLCKLPDCHCSSIAIPGGLNPKNIPQFVKVAFDDAISITNIETYRQLLFNRKNSNDCNIGATFYVSHEYTNYQFVNELYNSGFEIALHSISREANLAYWEKASYKDMVREFADQKILISHYANIPINDIKGVRVPYLQTTGNTSYHVMKDHGIEYDSSWPTIVFRNPGLWPYTLDYASIQDCTVPPCPTASIPGVWVSPLIPWTDLQGYPCSFVQACINVPHRGDEEAWFQFIKKNFERHYLGTRAPFSININQWYLVAYPAIYKALDRFIDLISNSPDIFMVNESEVIDWSRNPVPTEVYRTQNCRSFSPSPCIRPITCQLKAQHNDITYFMPACSPCPLNYPWLGNPIGK